MTTTLRICRVDGVTSIDLPDPLSWADDDLCQSCADGDFLADEEV